jgi:hypothetical protein
MKKIRLQDLGGAAQQVLADAGQDESVVIEDEKGQPRYGVIPFRNPTDQQKQQAWDKLRHLQQKVGASMREQRVTEDDLIRELLKDD